MSRLSEVRQRVDWSSFLGNLDFVFTTEITTGYRFFRFLNIAYGSGCDDVSSLYSGAWAEVYYGVSAFHGLLVVLYYDYCVAHVAETL